jgi:hypothetical protein
VRNRFFIPFLPLEDHFSNKIFSHESFLGQLEERLPFFSIYLPEKIRNTPSGSLAYKNLLQNANRITSPFDIYATLQDVLVWPDESELSSIILPLSRSMSLFRPIPEDRTCEQVLFERRDDLLEAPFSSSALKFEPYASKGGTL